MSIGWVQLVGSEGWLGTNNKRHTDQKVKKTTQTKTTLT
jgi:hypothetical protein